MYPKLRRTAIVTAWFVAVGCSSNAIGTSSDVMLCGNGQREASEFCDGADLGGLDCESLGYDDGSLRCTTACTFDESGCYVVDTCGNGLFNPDREECDGPHFGGLTCVDLGYDGGLLSCAVDCTYDTSGCTLEQAYCGNGPAEPPEVCDGSDLSGQTCADFNFYEGTLACAPDCSSVDTSGCEASCGDGVINGPELCDGTDLDGTAWCWGRGDWGQLGTGDSTTSATPLQVTGLVDAVSVTTGEWHSCALDSGGTAWC